MEPTDAERQVTILTLSALPAGKLLGALTGVLWPDSGNTVWDSIRARVEAMIDQKLAEYEYQNVEQSLGGLKLNIDRYQQRLHDAGTRVDLISDQYTATDTVFLDATCHFQQGAFAMTPCPTTGKSAILLLPLFARFANLHLALVRDGARHGAEWNWTPAMVATEKQRVKTLIADYTAYVRKTYDAALAAIEVSSDRKRWAMRNRWIRTLTIEALDKMHYWRWFDPDDTSPITNPTRVVYSDVVTGDRDDEIHLPDHTSTSPVSFLDVDGDASLWKIEVGWQGRPHETFQWREGGGRPIMTQGGSLIGRVTTVSLTSTDYWANQGSKWDYIERSGCTILALGYQDGGEASQIVFLGRPDHDTFKDNRTQYVFKYPGHVLDAVFLIGRSEATLIFGFRLANSY